MHSKGATSHDAGAPVADIKGGKIDWITTCKFFSSELGFGNLRIDGWATRAPLPRSPGPRTGRPTSLDT